MIGARAQRKEMNRTAVVIRRLMTLAAIVLTMVALAAPAAWAKTFKVNSTNHPGNGVCNATQCTLKEAVEEASTNTETDTINFKATLRGEIDLFNTLEKGGFSILNDAQPVDLTINGPGAGRLAVNGNDETRAFGIASGAAATISGLTIKNGKAVAGDPNGGGIANLGTLTLNNTTVSGNSATSGAGGGIYNTGTLTLNRLTVSRNEAITGGGINSSGTLTLNASTVSGNTADASGGGIFNNGTLTLNASTVSGNKATNAGGGGIFSRTDLTGKTTTIRNSTISGNTSNGSGGGIYNNGGTTTIESSTITKNTAFSASGSGVASFEDTANTRTEVLSSIISANANANDVEVIDDTTTNSFSSKGFNLIGGGDATAAFNQSGDQTGVTNPRLGTLANNGGPTRTHAVLKGSRAIDLGPLSGFPATDQRGKRRPQNGDGKGTSRCDIGAFEKKAVRR